MPWITLKHSDEPDADVCHVYIDKKGRVTKGPSGLIGANVKDLSKHVKHVKRHPEGVEPPHAKEHPQYTEHKPSKTIHVFGKNGPGKGYDVTVNNPLRELTEEETKKGLAGAFGAVKAKVPPAAVEPVNPGGSKAYRTHAEDASLLAAMREHGAAAAAHSRAVAGAGMAEYRIGGSLTEKQGIADKSDVAFSKAAQERATGSYDAARGALAQRQYDRLDDETKDMLKRHVDHRGRIDPNTAGHADADQVNHLVSVFQRLPDDKQLDYLQALSNAAGHTDPFAKNAPKFSPLTYATAANHITEHVLGWGGEHTAPMVIDKDHMPAGAKTFTTNRVRKAYLGRSELGPEHAVSRGDVTLDIRPEGGGKYTVVHENTDPNAPRETDVYGSGFALKDAEDHADRLLAGALGTDRGRLLFPTSFGIDFERRRPKTGLGIGKRVAA